VSEVALGVQFPSVLNAVHLGLYYQRVKARFPKVQVQPPVPPSFETFGGPASMPFTVQVQLGPMGLQPRMWFLSEDENSLIQLQSDRLLFNWRAGRKGSPYQHFDAVHAEFVKAFDELEALAADEGITGLVVNQCEVVYVNPFPTAKTSVPLSAPEKIFRVWNGHLGVEWQESPEDLSFNVRYLLNDKEGKPFGRLTAVVLSSGSSPQIESAFQLEITARGLPTGPGREGIAAFHAHGHQAIVRYFAALTTPEMHELWERYQ
jgi:uncharacterized protein (TIGR04255 family)